MIASVKYYRKITSRPAWPVFRVCDPKHTNDPDFKFDAITFSIAHGTNAILSGQVWWTYMVGDEYAKPGYFLPHESHIIQERCDDQAGALALKLLAEYL